MSQLGFGTASLASLDDRRAVWKLLDAALECGITHFDTARLYGDGTMERMLRPFVRSNRENITIASKFGLPGRWSGPIPSLLLPTARRWVKRISRHRRETLSQKAVGFDPPIPRLTVEAMQRSLRITLRELGTDSLDLFLMHEARPEQVSKDLLIALDSEKEKGLIKAYGSGGEWENTMSQTTLPWPSPPVLQAPVSLALADNQPECLLQAPTIIHSVFRGMGYLEGVMARERDIADFPGDQFSGGATLSEIFLRWALNRYPNSRVLIGARSISRIRANAAIAAKPIDASLLANQLDWLRQRGALSQSSL